MNASVKKSGFTLLELLIVILIIGLLSAISIPMYKKAVEKSKVSDALSTMQAVSKSEHGWYLVKNNYTKDFANLDIDLYDKDGNKAEDESFDSINYTFTLQDNAIKAERNNGEYSLYKLYEDGNIYCLPQDHYICEQYNWGVNRQLCNSINGFWANKTSTCYNTEEERCAGVDMPWAQGGYSHYAYAFCGYYDTDQVEIDGFGICGVAHISYGAACSHSTFTGADVACTDARNPQGNIIYGANNTSCSYSQFNDGAVCEPSGTSTCVHDEFNSSSVCQAHGHYACSASTFTANSKCVVSLYTSCSASIFSDGAECISSSDNDGCHDNIFKAGGKCIANSATACRNINWLGSAYNITHTFEPGSYCVGNAENSCKGFRNFQATCVANAPGACAGNTYTGNGCCSGDYCPESAPKCN